MRLRYAYAINENLFAKSADGDVTAYLPTAAHIKFTKLKTLETENAIFFSPFYSVFVSKLCHHVTWDNHIAHWLNICTNSSNSEMYNAR